MSLVSQLKDDFNESTSEYLEWLKSRNVNISSKITIHDYTSINQGRGVIALKDIKEGEILATIPKTALINVQQNLLICEHPNLKHYLMRLSHWDALIIILLFELRNKEQSQWLKYINVLPQKGFNQLMFWSQNELNLLQPSYVIERVGKEAADEMYHKALDIIKELKIDELDEVAFDEYNVVATIIMSYSFDVELTKEEEKDVREQLGEAEQEEDRNFDEGEEVPELVQHGHGSHNGTTEVKSLLERNGIPLDEAGEVINDSAELQYVEESEREHNDGEGGEEGEEDDEEEEEGGEEEEDDDYEASSGPPEILSDGYIKSMVPLADTLNADTNYNNAIINYEQNALVITSIKAIKKGDQVYNTYSNHPNGEILRRYGYVEPRGSKGDFGEVPISIIYQFFIEKYLVHETDLSQLLEIVGEITFQEQMKDNSLDDDEVTELILDSYDCFKTGEVTIELIFLVQLLTTFFMIQRTNEEITHHSVRRVYRKIYQLIESKKITQGSVKNLQEILQIRLDQYPDYAAEPFTKDTGSMARDVMAAIVLKSEFQSLSACLQDLQKTVERTLDAPVKVINDAKLARAITDVGEKGHVAGSGKSTGGKRPGGESESNKAKKLKR
ncbi:RMS1 [Candida margitis]|uniref:RMS1 n=1 Tax=Candida margitis TaxID=1775924 RepID=UPI002227A516|nr:RMS1 [Candida margitis]KAI5969534.1 RMS1 [Candida margitis]